MKLTMKKSWAYAALTGIFNGAQLRLEPDLFVHA